MELNEYQNLTKDTVIYPGQGEFWGVLYCSLGLASEAGEVVGKVKKMLRDDSTYALREAALKELGDTLWYLARLADELGCDLESIARHNLIKLQDRKDRAVLQGSGDDR